MSKILKVVDGKHYVAGGPKCKRCQGTRMLTTWRGRHVYRQSDNKPCRICHGTGLQPVEEWPDAELDRFLNDHFETWDLRMRREMHTNNPIYYIEGEPFILNPPCDDTSRGAKVWAVIAVAEVER